MTPRGLVILAIATAFLLMGIAFLMLPTGNEWTARARRDWKNDAIAVIEQQLAGATPTTQPQASAWAGGDVLFMKNGEWIVSRNICRKEDARVSDLFIGRGSDGQWYYSTFHFCVGHTVLMAELQPESLVQFAKSYWLEVFDGRSDRALQPTWRESDPWGPGRAKK